MKQRLLLQGSSTVGSALLQIKSKEEPVEFTEKKNHPFFLYFIHLHLLIYAPGLLVNVTHLPWLSHNLSSP